MLETALLVTSVFLIGFATGAYLYYFTILKKLGYKVKEMRTKIDGLFTLQTKDSYACRICGAVTAKEDFDYKDGNLYEGLKKDKLCENCARCDNEAREMEMPTPLEDIEGKQ